MTTTATGTSPVGSAPAGPTLGTLAYRIVRALARFLLWLFYRRAEAGDDPWGNDDVSASAVAALRAGRVILIFPAGTTPPQPIVMPWRTGAARLAIGAERAMGGASRVTLLPVGLVFHGPG